MKKSILIDIDGVILNWCAGFVTWMANQGHRPGLVDVTDIHDLVQFCPDLDYEQSLAAIRRFNETPDFGRLSVYPDAIAGLAGLRKILPDWPVVAITAAGSTSRTADLRKENLAWAAIDNIIAIPIGERKLQYLQRFPAGSVFIEDAAHHAADGHASGHISFLLSRRWNIELHPAGVRRAEGWEQLVRAVALMNLDTNQAGKAA